MCFIFSFEQSSDDSVKRQNKVIVLLQKYNWWLHSIFSCFVRYYVFACREVLKEINITIKIKNVRLTENNSGHFSLLIMKHLHGILMMQSPHFFNVNFNFNFFARFIAIFEQRIYIYKNSKQSILKGKIGMFILMRNMIPWHLRIFCRN